MERKHTTALIIGAGPAGLTAAYELLKRTTIVPHVIECDKQVGGLAKTIDYKGNKIDIGGHRFFSKSDRVMAWWQAIMPFERVQSVHPNADLVMLGRKRLSRIYYLRRFFDYPVSLSRQTLKNLGMRRVVAIITSYLRTRT